MASLLRTPDPSQGVLDVLLQLQTAMLKGIKFKNIYIKGKPEKNVKMLLVESKKNIYEPKKLQTLLQKHTVHQMSVNRAVKTSGQIYGKRERSG